MRFVPLGAAEGQAVLARLHDRILETAGRATEMTPEEIRSATPGADLAAMAHETMDVRIFRS